MLGGYSLIHSRPVHPLSESAGGRFLAVDYQHGFAIRPSVWPIPSALPPYLSASEGLVFEGQICWVVGYDDGIRRSGGLIENYQSFRG